MAYICLSCFTEYNKETIKISETDYSSRCPNAKCGDLNLVEVDDLILPVIRLLNMKGYTTKFCCSGHGYDNNTCRNTYIVFSNKSLPSNLPIDFIAEDDEYYKKNYGKFEKPQEDIAIRKYYNKELTREEYELQLYTTMMELLSWARGLPIKEYDEIYCVINGKKIFLDEIEKWSIREHG